MEEAGHVQRCDDVKNIVSVGSCGLTGLRLGKNGEHRVACS